jgi:ribosomal protein L40E
MKKGELYQLRMKKRDLRHGQVKDEEKITTDTDQLRMKKRELQTQTSYG